MRFFSEHFNAFGLDIGDHSLKVAHMKKTALGCELISYGRTTVQHGVFENGIIKKEDLLINRIKNLIARAKGKKITTKYVHASLPEIHGYIKVIRLSSEHDQELEADLYDALPSHVPLEPEKLIIDWHVIARNEKKSTIDVLVAATPKEIAQSYTNVLRKAGLEPVSLQVEAEAIQRSLMPMSHPPMDPIALIDIGAVRSSFICVRNGIIQFTTSLPASDEEIVHTIKQELSITHPEAEKAKLVCGLDADACEGAVAKILKPMLEEITQAIKQNLTFYEEHFGGAMPIKHLIICGGGAALRNVDKALQREISDVKVLLGNPLINLARGKKIVLKSKKITSLTDVFTLVKLKEVNAPKEIIGTNAMKYTTVLGLALTDM